MTWKQARRYLGYSIALLCLPLTLASIFLWVRSYFACDSWEYVTARTDGSIEEIHRSAMSLLGRMEIENLRHKFTCATPETKSQFEGMVLSAVGFFHDSSEPRPAVIIDGRLPTIWEQLSFDHSYEQYSSPIDPAEGVSRLHQKFSISIPYWAPTILFLTPPLLVVYRIRRRAAIGCCRRCGYDLRASPERCPECGLSVHRDRPAELAAALRRTGQRAIGLAAALSMFGASITAMFWARSHWIGDRASRTLVWTDTDYMGNNKSKETRYQVASAAGQLIFEVSTERFTGRWQSSIQQQLHEHSGFAYNSFPPTTPLPVGVPPRSGPLGRMGFYHSGQETDPFTTPNGIMRSHRDFLTAMPHWALLLALLILPATLVARRLQTRSRATPKDPSAPA